MKKTNENEEIKTLIKENIWKKIKNWFKKLFPQNIKNLNYIEDTYKTKKKLQEQKVEITQNKDNEEKVSTLIKQAREAYENYMLADQFEIEKTVYKYIEERIKENEKNIKKIIEINKTEISFDVIIKTVEEEEKNLKEYKKTIRTRKIDDKFVFSEYQVPEGIIGVEVKNSKEAIENILKAITTKNAIIVMQEAYEKYSVENLILLIVKESLSKFNIDNNIIQMVEEKEIKEQDKKELDVLITKDKKEQRKESKEKLYIYLEDDYFKEVVEQEIKKLNLIGKEVEVITGEFYNCIRKINESRNLGVSIYSQDRKKGYKFINLINSKNVFFNSTLQNIDETKPIEAKYLVSKNIICEYKIF